MELQSVKQRFGIIGNCEGLNRALEIAVQVAATDITVLIIGESGVGKEKIPQIIHNLSSRKHGPYIAVNCGGIPEGTIDSELFGHEKGSFTGASETHKGYFESVDHGTIFLDEVGELPLSTQAKLLRVLETKEFMKVGSNKVQKTDVRIVAATNVNMAKAVKEGKFREDLYYRLNTVQINLPPLRERGEDIALLFRKFASDFADKYHCNNVRLTESAVNVLNTYHWPGNIRQLRNLTEQVSIMENEREISGNTILKYLPDYQTESHPVLVTHASENAHAQGPEMHPAEMQSDRQMIYTMLFEIRKDIEELRKEVHEALSGVVPVQHIEKATSYDIGGHDEFGNDMMTTINRPIVNTSHQGPDVHRASDLQDGSIIDTEELKEETLSLVESECRLITEALEKHAGKRKAAAEELGISERTLYRKLKEYGISK